MMYLNGGMDGEESVYVTSEDGFYRLKGYQVYYERNQMMQDYMILRKDSHRVESGSGDRVIRDFRTRLEERKDEAVTRYSTIRTLGLLCSMLSVVVLAGGVVMFNNYQKMKEMESVLVSVLPEQVKWLGENAEPEKESMIVEEIKGSVVPETLGEDVYSSEAAESVNEEKTEENRELEDKLQKDKAQEKKIPEAGGNATAQKDYPAVSQKTGDGYLIREGQTLYGICFELYGSLKYLDEIRSLNQLDDDNHIVAGQTLILPDIS